MLCGLDTSDTRSSRSVVEQVYYLLLFNLPAKLQETKLFTFKTPFFGNSSKKIFTIEHHHKTKASVSLLGDQRILSS
jgi:hypothetical protein